MRIRLLALTVILVGLFGILPSAQSSFGSTIVAQQSVTYFVYDRDYPSSPFVWISGMRYSEGRQFEAGTYAIRLDVSTNTFTARYLSGSFRGYIPADNKTHFAFSEMQGTKSFIIRKSDLSFTQCINAGTSTSALFAAGFDENNDIWWGVYDTTKEWNQVYRLHTSGCKWQILPIASGIAGDGHPWMGIQGGMVNSTIWFLKQGTGYLSSFNIHTRQLVEYKVASVSYPETRINEATIDYATQTIWMTGYGLGKIYRFSVSDHSLATYEVTHITGKYPVSTLLYNSRYLLITNLSSSIYVWDTTQPFSSAAIEILTVPGTATSNLGGPSTTSGAVIANSIIQGRFSNIVSKIHIGQSSTTQTTSSSVASFSTFPTATTSSVGTLGTAAIWFVVVTLVAVTATYSWKRTRGRQHSQSEKSELKPLL